LCRVRPGSRARIEPTADVLIAFEAGTFLCGTTESGPRALFSAGASLHFYSNDPVFIVRIHKDASIRLEVLQGFLAAESGRRP